MRTPGFRHTKQKHFATLAGSIVLVITLAGCSTSHTNDPSDSTVDTAIIVAEQPLDWTPTIGERVRVEGIARFPGKGLPLVETDRHGNWLTAINAAHWPANVEGQRVSLTGIVAQTEPAETEDGLPVQWYSSPTFYLYDCKWAKVADNKAGE